MYAYITLKFELTLGDIEDYSTAQKAAEEISLEIDKNAFLGEVVKVEVKDD